VANPQSGTLANRHIDSLANQPISPTLIGTL
jgi:hypothetical protein